MPKRGSTATPESGLKPNRKGAIQALDLPDVGAPFLVRRSTRAKHLQAAVRHGQVEVIVPGWARPRHIRRFVLQARTWIVAKNRELDETTDTVLPRRCESGAKVRLDGDRTSLRVDAGFWPSASVEHTDELIVRVPLTAAMTVEESARRLLREWLEQRALAAAEHSIARFSPRLGATPSAVAIKDQKTLWGSCGRNGRIHLNWRLIGAPPPVFDYIVVHELCHLRERNHSPRFWKLVEELMPRYREPKSWLRRHGRLLG